MTLGALACLHFHVTARRLIDRDGKSLRAAACYAAAAVSCLGACLSNATAAVIPLLIVAWDVLIPPRPSVLKVMTSTATLWVIGLATVVIKMAGPPDELADGIGAFSPVRLMLVTEVFWLNLKTVFWPTALGLGYANCRPESLSDPAVILGAAALVLTLLAAWMLRRKTPILFGPAWFVIALLPTSQILPHHLHRADRFLYLPLAGLAVAVAMAVAELKKTPPDAAIRRRIATLAVALGAFVLLLLAARSAAQVWTWHDDLAVWENALRGDPKNAFAHCNLADHWAMRRQFDRAVEIYREALRLHPDDARIARNYAWLCATCEDECFRDPPLAVRLAERACALAGHPTSIDLAVLAEAYASSGRLDQAIPTIRRAIREAQAAGDGDLGEEYRVRLEGYEGQR